MTLNRDLGPTCPEHLGSGELGARCSHLAHMPHTVRRYGAATRIALAIANRKFYLQRSSRGTQCSLHYAITSLRRVDGVAFRDVQSGSTMRVAFHDASNRQSCVAFRDARVDRFHRAFTQPRRVAFSDVKPNSRPPAQRATAHLRRAWIRARAPTVWTRG